MPSISFFLRRLILAALLSIASRASAHDPGLSTLTVTIGTQRTEAVLRVGSVDLAALAGAGDPSAADLLLSVDSAPQRAVETIVARDADEGAEVRWRFPAARGERFSIRFMGLDRLSPGHKQVVTAFASDGRRIGARLVGADSATPVFDLPREQRGAGFRAFGSWVALGAGHVAEGWDHVAFLLAILLGCTRRSSVVRAVTAFTLAHSVTLGMAASGWLRVSPALVEPTIAASIVFVALRNVFRAGSAREPLAAIFALGLVHGLGFAGQLSGLVAGAGGGLVSALLGFNLGIELAQLAGVLLVLPVLEALRRAPVWQAAVVRVGSLALALLGASWLVERLGS